MMDVIEIRRRYQEQTTTIGENEMNGADWKKVRVVLLLSFLAMFVFCFLLPLQLHAEWLARANLNGGQHEPS